MGERLVLAGLWFLVAAMLLLAVLVVVLQAAPVNRPASDHVGCVDRADRHLRCFDGPPWLMRWLNRWLFGVDSGES